MSRNTRKATESTPATVNKPMGVAVGVRAEEVEGIVAKAVSTATTVVRDQFMKHINDLHQFVLRRDSPGGTSETKESRICERCRF